MQATLWQQLVHRLAPNCCLWCQMQVQQPQAQLCDYCHAQLPGLDLSWVEQNALLLPAVAQGLQRIKFDRLYSLSWYKQPYRHWISQWKFQQQHAAGQLLCQLIYQHAVRFRQQGWPLPDCISYTPVSDKRLQERGFNQAKLLAQQLAEAWQKPCVSLFQSPQLVPHQIGLKRKERLANLKGKVQLQERPLPAHVTLVDDVITTGATLDYLSALLKAKGVQTVSVWTLAITRAF
ncbi:ComF family protein [Rheinheimera mesophila]|uniref:ComF family protein n=1 Tax=Rheinheimera mesophila TaxID=1547515 RepID=A0A3P3QCL9_9GAMM|nr:ComF family protein [Rheinheimera mesophila]RRJ18828.1 ComF family protein [Rheinheimera mesophila]